MIIKKILIGVENSEHAMKAIETGFDLAHRLDAEIALAHIIEPVVMQQTPDAGMLGTNDISYFPVEMGEIQNEQSVKLLDDVEARFAQGKTCKRYIEVGKPSTDLVGYAQDFGADMIVIGTHGRTGIDRLLMGSVAEHVVRHSHVPVLVVPFKEKGQ